MGEALEQLILMANFVCEVADGQERGEVYVQQARDLLKKLDIPYRVRGIKELAS